MFVLISYSNVMWWSLRRAHVALTLRLCRAQTHRKVMSALEALVTRSHRSQARSSIEKYAQKKKNGVISMP